MTERHRNRIDLVSFTQGSGSTFEAITQSSFNGLLKDRLRVVGMIAGFEGIGAIERANRLEVPYAVIDRREFPKGKEGRELFGRAMLKQLNVWSPDIVTQNGWLTLTPEIVISEVGEIYNQHPAPLDPDHKNSEGKPLHVGGRGIHGLAAHATLLYFQRLVGREFPTEATIHRVTQRYDEGAVVYRAPVGAQKFERPETLAARVLPVEHETQIAFLMRAYLGTIVEHHRKVPLVEDCEEKFLWAAMEVARMHYPAG